MRSALTEVFWQAFCRYEGIGASDYQTTTFKTPPRISASLLIQMAAGTKRVVSAAMDFFGEGKEYFLPRVGDHTILLDQQGRPKLIWRSTGITIAPLSSVTNEFVWRDCTGNGDRAEWLRSVVSTMTDQARKYNFEMHDEIETMFETVEVVWPRETAKRIRLVMPHLDRGIELLGRLEEQSDIVTGLNAILARIRTAVFTVGPEARVRFTNPAAEALLRLGDGLRVKGGSLTARQPADKKALAAAICAACKPGTADKPLVAAQRPRGTGGLVTISRGESQPPYRVSVFPLRPGHAIAGLAASARAVLFVDNPDEPAEPAQANHYSRVFRLSPAEARLAVHFASGGSLATATDVLGVTYNTVRAQLRAIFDKTDTHRQTELLRLLEMSRSLRISLS